MALRAAAAIALLPWVAIASAQEYPWRGGRKVTLEVELDRPIAQISPRHFGQNVAWWNGGDWAARRGIVRRFEAAGFGLLRFPGGSSSDEYFWDGDFGSFSQWAESHQPWTLELDEFLELCRRTGAEPIFTVNYGLARLASVEAAAALAARWVRYVNVERDLGVQLWEIGNELFGSWETGHFVAGKPELTGDAYGRDLIEIAAAMKAVDPTILVGATAAEVNDAYGRWNERMFPVIQEDADFLIVHQYFLWPFTGPGGSYEAPMARELLSNVAEVGRIKQRMAQLERRTTSRTEPWPVALTEFNVILANAPPTVALVNGLFTAEVLGEVIRHGYLAANIWDARNGWGDPGGDHGMFALNDPSTPDDAPRSSFYAYSIYREVFSGKMVSARLRGSGVKAWASWDAASRTLGLVLVNERERPAEVIFDGLPAVRGTPRAWVLEGPELMGRTLRFNGVPGPDGAGPFPLPHRHGLRVDLSGGRLGLAPASVTGLRVRLR